jgi:putative addiction module component (TIGR02574 family)
VPVTLEQFGIDRLSVEDQLELVGLIWDRIRDADGATVTVPDWHWRVIHERIADANANPDAALPWEEVRARILRRS